jgi:hypothetical protein
VKIIGENPDGFIVSMSADDAANLLGYYSKYNPGAQVALRVGDEVQIHAMYSQLRELAQMHTQLEAARRMLESITRQLQLVPPLIPKVTVEEPKPS